MDKRGASVSIFIIIALSIIFTSILFFSLNQGSLPERIWGSVKQSTNLETEYNSLQTHVQSCLADKTLKGIEEYGLKWTSEEKIEQLILSELEACIDFPYFEERGVAITRGTPTVKVTISDDAVTSDLEFVLTVTVNEETATATRFEYNLKREKELSLTDAPRQGSELRAVSEDFYAELIVHVGTTATDASGNSLGDKISLKVLDRNFDALSNLIIIGNTVYELKPDGARFSQPMTLKLKYDKAKLPPGANEPELRIVWYDEDADIWKAVPTELDPKNSILSAEIYHFSVYGVGYGCAGVNQDQEPINEISIEETAFSQLCGTREVNVDDPSGGDTGTCPVATKERGWSDDGQIAGVEEKAYSDKVPIIKVPNPYVTLGQVPHTEEASLLDWDQDDQAWGPLSQVTINPGGTTCSMTSAELKEYCIEQCSSEAKASFGENGENLEERFFSEDSLKDGTAIVCNTLLNPQKTDCTGVVCIQKEVATPMTYGYKDEGQLSGDKTLAGGWGVLFFTVADDGDSCVADSGTLGSGNFELEKLSITLLDSSEEQNPAGYPYQVCADPVETGTESCDNFITEDTGKVVKQVLYNPQMNTEQGVVKSLEESPEKDMGFQSGQNGIYFRIENLDEDTPNGCVWAEMGATLAGKGIIPGRLDMEIDTVSEGLQAGGFGFTYGGTSASGWSDCASGISASGLSGLGTSCSELGTDPDKDKTSEFCTDWEAALSAEQTSALIAGTAAEKWQAMDASIKSEFEKSGMDLEKFQKLMIAIAMQESSLAHCSLNGRVKSGDGGSAIGLMQIPKSQPSYRIAKNIEMGIEHLIGKFTMVDCRAGHTLDCSETCENLGGTGCSDDQKTYSGWECAVRGYNGWGCKYKGADGIYKYCGPDCNSYLEKVSKYKDQIKDIPICSGSSSSSGTSLASCAITTTSPTTGTSTTITIPSQPIIGGITPPPGGSGAIASAAMAYIGCRYVYGPVMSTNSQNCRQSPYGFTCATFVSQAIKDACHGFWLYGHGRDKCSDPTYVSSVSLGQLQPGDIFSWSDGSYGHTGLYLGNNGGENVFIDAWPGAGVRYVTLSQLQAQNSGIRFCRIKNC